MGEDEPFLRALLLNPEDHTTRSVYADWLEERGDERAEYLRLERDLAALPAGDDNVPAWGRRLAELRARIEPAWLARVGSHQALGSDRFEHVESDSGRLERAASILGRLVAYVDGEGYERTITGAAEHPVTGTLAYVECRSQWRGALQDIHFHLRIRDGKGGEVAWE